jgi:hypothetical protein
MLNDITFTENGPVDVAQLDALHRLIGWDKHERHTETETAEMLRVSHYYIAAHTAEGRWVGFARVCGDPYIVQRCWMSSPIPISAVAALPRRACWECWGICNVPAIFPSRSQMAVESTNSIRVLGFE